MKKLTLIFALPALALMIGPLAAQPPQGTTNLTFDGFCDGLTVNVNGDFIGGTHNNWDCAGSVAAIGGFVGTVARVKPAGFRGVSEAVLSDAVGQVALASCPLNLYLLFGSTNKWAFYYSCDGVSPQILLNSGTFTITAANKPLARGGVASYQGRGGNVDDSNITPEGTYPKGPYTISFDGFCDFLVVNTKGNNIGGTHDLNTNCGFGIMAHVDGNNEQQPADLTGTSGAGAFLDSDQSFYEGSPGCVTNYSVTFATKTWAVYAYCDGSGMFLVNTGTFTMTAGTPPPVKGAPSTIGTVKH
jgi:hypothetical protein